MKRYYGKFKIGSGWLSWHLIDGLHEDIKSAKERFMKNTKFTKKEVEITDVEPEKYCGRV